MPEEIKLSLMVRTIPQSRTNPHNYADHAKSKVFRSGFTRTSTRKTDVIMCAESVWCRCHRRIIADYFIAADEKVFNLLGPNHVEATRITDGAKFERLAL